MITTKTADRLNSRALEATAIADALHSAGFRAESDVVARAARDLANAARSLEEKLASYAKSALADGSK